jgi:glycosyltransferase involved in cell wall biosynthesis
MIVGIVTNKASRGLLLDATLLEEQLVAMGHTAELVQFDEPWEKEYELMFFLEVIPPRLVKLSKNPPWFWPNLEFMHERDFKLVNSTFGKVCCKTWETFHVCATVFPEKAVFTGFCSRDRYNEIMGREPRFLHVCGQSHVKNTEAVLDAWRWKKDGQALQAKLYVVSDWLKMEDVPENVTVLNFLPDDELAILQNVCLYHLQPSAVEGFGHTIREAMSVGADILTTDAPPMNELSRVDLIPSLGETSYNMAVTHQVSALDIHHWVRTKAAVERSLGSLARTEFLADNALFQNIFLGLMKDFQPTPKPAVVSMPNYPNQKRIAFLGNFRAPESTESLIRWALEEGLGHEVVTLQENQVTYDDLKNATGTADVFMWVRTPRWLPLAESEMLDFLELLRRRKVPSASVHLDKFWGIPDREPGIGVDAFWKTDFVFTADGSMQQAFLDRGVNHFYMRPAMSEVHLHPGIAREGYRCDVGFVGAKGYHTCYPFRTKLIEFLEHTYRGRFKLFNNVRGHDLNDVYASIKVTVGDCIFAGIPHYYSDRMPETAGRYGFLLAPRIPGMTIPFALYEPQDIDTLRGQINHWLEHPAERMAISRECADHVRKYDTWTIRMEKILQIVTGGVWMTKGPKDGL